MDFVWRETFRVRVGEVDPSGRLSAAHLARYLQETADSHCRPHGLSVSALMGEDRMWVLTRLALQVTRWPTMLEEVTVETWGSHRLGGARAYRDFRVFDGSGEAIAEASSVWLMLDARTRRPVRLPELVLKFRHPERETPEPVDAKRLTEPEQPSVEVRLPVLWRDLDTNEHANNVCYIEWALEAVPLELRRKGALTALDIQFVGEALLGQEVVSAVEMHDNECWHSLRAGNGRLVAVLRTKWLMPAASRA